MLKKKVIISACLLGENCRYDGQAKQNNQILEDFKECKIIPFCPEAPIFGTPRERISVVDIDGKNRIITDETNRDITQILEDEINSFIEKNPQADKIVLKSKSPSCGLGTTPILNKQKKIIKYGSGLAGEIFQKSYQNTSIEDENSYL